MLIGFAMKFLFCYMCNPGHGVAGAYYIATHDSGALYNGSRQPITMDLVLTILILNNNWDCSIFYEQEPIT